MMLFHIKTFPSDRRMEVPQAVSSRECWELDGIWGAAAGTMSPTHVPITPEGSLVFLDQFQRTFSLMWLPFVSGMNRSRCPGKVRQHRPSLIPKLVSSSLASCLSFR